MHVADDEEQLAPVLSADCVQVVLVEPLVAGAQTGLWGKGKIMGPAPGTRVQQRAALPNAGRALPITPSCPRTFMPTGASLVILMPICSSPMGNCGCGSAVIQTLQGSRKPLSGSRRCAR